MVEDKEQSKKDLEAKILQVQKSTQTLFNVFIPAHNWCRQKATWYYNWHLNPMQPAVHLTVFLLVIAGAVLFFTNYLHTTASPSSTEVSDKGIAQKEEILDLKIDQLINQTSRLSTDVVLKEVSRRLAGTNKALLQISSQIKKDLNSETTQQEIRDQIKNDLAKENTLSQISEKIGEIPESSVVDQLSQILAKTSTEATLFALKEKIESGLGIEANLLEEVKSRIGDLTDPASGSANDLLRKIEKQLSTELAVAITNWIESIKITNWPTEFPDPNVSRSQEQIGKDYFNREQSFTTWASRRGYLKTAYSGVVANPTSGTADLLPLRVPDGHTYYIINTIYTTKNATSTIIKVLQASKKGEFASVVMETGTQSIPSQVPVQVKVGDEIRWQIVGDRDASGGTTLTVYYIDLPWEE